MKRGQVFVRGRKADGEIGNIDVMDLTEESFRAFVTEKLIDLGAVCAIQPAQVDGDHIDMTEKKPEGA